MLRSPQPLLDFVLVSFPDRYGRWQFHANDDTPGGWLAVGIYAAISVLCWREVFREAPAHALQRPFWTWLSIGVTAIGINKQLDLQTLMIEIGWRAARFEGITEYRRGIQIVSAAAAAVIAVSITGYLWRLAKRVTFSERMVLAGACGLVEFVLLRTAKFMHLILTQTMTQRHPMLAVELVVSSFLCFAVWMNGRAHQGLSSSS